MQILFSKDGKEVKVVHAIDARDRVATGELFYKNPKEAKRVTKPKAKAHDNPSS